MGSGEAIGYNFLTSEEYGEKWNWLLNYINNVRIERGKNGLSALDGQAESRGEIHNWLNSSAAINTSGYGSNYSNRSDRIYTVYYNPGEISLEDITSDILEFNGWYTQADFTGEKVDVINANCELYAKLNKKVKLILNPMGGIFNDPVVMTSLLVDHNYIISIKATQHNTNYNINYENNVFLSDKNSTNNALYSYRIAIKESEYGLEVIGVYASGTKGVTFPEDTKYVLYWAENWSNLSNQQSNFANIHIGDILVPEMNVSDLETGLIDCNIKIYTKETIEEVWKNNFEVTITNTYILPSVIKGTNKFVGWYDNDAFEGNPINELNPEQIDGNEIVLYALFEGAFTIKMNFNGGTYKYPTREDMVNDFLNDFNNFSGKNYTTVAAYQADSSKTTFWKDIDMREKWLWIWDEIRTLAKAQGEDVTYIDNLINGTSYSGYAIQNVAIYMLGINNTIWNDEYKATYGGLSSKWTTIDATGIDANSFRKYFQDSVETITITKEAYELPTEIYKTGYKFGGWYTSNDFTGDAVTIASANCELYALWLEDC